MSILQRFNREIMNKSVKLFALLCLSLLVSCGGGSDERPAASGQSILAATSTQVQPPAPLPQDYRDAVQKIYVAYFGRPADVAGLAYFEASFLTAGSPTALLELSQSYSTNPAVKSLIDSFSNSAESAALYPGDNNAFIIAIYLNLFNRAADDAGKAYWADLINRGLITRANAAISIMSGARSTDATIVNNKMTVAIAFTTGLNTAAKSNSYSGLTVNAFVRSILALVSNVTNTANFQVTIDSAIADLPYHATPTPVPVVGKQCYVNGYYRASGTYVHGYWRSC